MDTVGERIASLEKRIADLERAIEGYDADLRTATSEDRQSLQDLIRSSRDTVNRLLDERTSLRSSTSGKSLRISSN
jgi:uncharacterized coiled-coil protein SlyX